ncbi:hypothetical protein ACRN94_14405 [Shewanella baltica]|uniref:hypothetical protein n=1 Tax=Shewanella baltica TaxID=62322 RepID=UPI00217E6CAD|nr:hypothetical protein [Shewanella baltica]MCS6101802.1 hypothetical protein [Shewanella baltica]MCS6184804.1 hypothetical protein [Shewanella baltica]
MNKLLILVTIILLQGCGAIANTYLPEAVIADNDNTIKYFNESGQIKLSIEDITSLNGNDEMRKAFIAQAISSSDKKCTQHQANIISNANSWNVGMGSLSLLLTGTAAVVGHAQTAAELAAAATALTGIQALTNEEIYANAMGTTIVRAIDVGRAKSLAIITKKTLTDSSSKYTVQDALVDIQRYHSQCSLMAGLIEVTKALEQRKLSSQEIELKQKQLEKNITTFATNIIEQNKILLPSTEVKVKQEQAINEMNERLKSLILQNVESPEY